MTDGRLLQGRGDVYPKRQCGHRTFCCQKKLESSIAGAIETEFGFKPQTLLLTEKEFRTVIADNPFADEDPKQVHTSFLAATPVNPDMEKIAALAGAGEAYHLGKHAFYLHAPKGIGNSKLAAGVEKSLGVRITARNGRTVAKLLEIVVS